MLLLPNVDEEGHRRIAHRPISFIDDTPSQRPAFAQDQVFDVGVSPFGNRDGRRGRRDILWMRSPHDKGYWGEVVDLEPPAGVGLHHR